MWSTALKTRRADDNNVQHDTPKRISLRIGGGGSFHILAKHHIEEGKKRGKGGFLVSWKSLLEKGSNERFDSAQCFCNPFHSYSVQENEILACLYFFGCGKRGVLSGGRFAAFLSGDEKKKKNKKKKREHHDAYETGGNVTFTQLKGRAVL